MDDKVAENAVLDYVVFQVSSAENSYEALISCNGILEKLAHGSLDQLAVHLPNARATTDGSFKLEPNENIKSSAWFTKFIVGRFLHVVNVPDVLKLANDIENEILQLEETRKFHVSLYAKDYPLQLDGREADSNLNDSGLTQQVKVETASSDATKNELLRALDSRISTLKDELSSSFNRAVGAACSIIQFFDLATFCHCFGATELRDSLLKSFDLCPNNSPFDIASNLQEDEKPATTTYVSPAKVAQAERQSSLEAEDGSDQDRSRPTARSATPRRSSSPMRRIQIGKSGSRRSTALAIKSLSYFPSREKAIPVGEDEDLANKPEVNVSRMSVQDAINLFESKQKDQKDDLQRRRDAEVLSLGGTKSVLRRWSSSSVQEDSSDSVQGIVCSNLDSDPEEKEKEKEEEKMNVELNLENLEGGEAKEDKRSTAEWSLQKEAELNEMLMKMMETSKPSKYDRKEEKLRAENAGNQTPATSSTKVGGGKRLSPKPRRNSCPPVLSNREPSKPSSTKKVASKTPTPPNPRRSLSSGPLKKACTPPPPPPPAARTSASGSSGRHSKSLNSIIPQRAETKEGKKVTASPPDSGAFSRSGFQAKHTKKSTVVPLETKPFLRKGSGINPGVGYSVPKVREARVRSKKTGSQSSASSPSGPANKVIDETLAPPLDNDVNIIQTAENVDGSLLTLAAVSDGDDNVAEPRLEEMSISSAAWVDVEIPERSPSSSSRDEKQEVVCSPAAVAPAVSPGPRVRHSLSQMLLADTGEQEVVGWGNAENPPSLVYQKDAPKGLKRLLKFARKGKLEGSSTALSSPLGLSEGEEEREDSKAVVGKRSSDHMHRKSSSSSSQHAKAQRQPKFAAGESFDGGSSSKRSDKLRDGHVPTTKATRSFFSLSTFRSSKSGEGKLR